MKDIFQRYKSLLPVILLTLYCIPAIIASYSEIHLEDGSVSRFVPSIKHNFAFGAVILCYSAFFFYRPLFKYIFSVTIILGLFSLLIFTRDINTVTIRIVFLIVSFQPSALWAGLLAFILNFKKANEWIAELTKYSPSESKRISNNIWEEEVNKYMERFKGKSTIELSKIVEENKLVASAVEASRRLLEERVKSNGES